MIEAATSIWLHVQLGDRLADRVLIAIGGNAYHRHDGVAMVPLALRGP